METNFKRCGEGENVCNCKSEKECGYLSQEYEDGMRQAENDLDMDDFMEDDFDDDDELVPVDCPNCQRTYDDADADFLICHHCGYNANTGKVDRRKISGRNMLGLDADANDVWL